MSLPYNNSAMIYEESMIDPNNPFDLPEHIAEEMAREAEHQRETDAQRRDEPYIQLARLAELLEGLATETRKFNENFGRVFRGHDNG